MGHVNIDKWMQPPLEIIRYYKDTWRPDLAHSETSCIKSLWSIKICEMAYPWKWESIIMSQRWLGEFISSGLVASTSCWTISILRSLLWQYPKAFWSKANKETRLWKCRSTSCLHSTTSRAVDPACRLATVYLSVYCELPIPPAPWCCYLSPTWLG